MKRLAGVLVLVALAWGISQWRRSSTGVPPTPEVEMEDSAGLPPLPGARPPVAPPSPRVGENISFEAEPTSRFVPEQIDADWRTLPLTSGFEMFSQWPGWKCADIAGNPSRSFWVREEENAEGSAVYRGSCAEWARLAQAPGEKIPEAIRDNVPPSAADPRLRDQDFGDVRGWSGWQCADDPDGSYRSYWRLPGHSGETAMPFAGTCDAWSGRKQL